MRQRYFLVALLVLVTAWVAATRPWAAPGFAALAAGQAFLAGFWLRARSGRPMPGAVLAFLALSYFGLAYLLALLTGTPESGRFWIVLAVGLSILAPGVVWARRLFRESGHARAAPRVD
jgi:hypothetical protein